MKTEVAMSVLRSTLPEYCRWIFYSEQGAVVTVSHNGSPVIEIMHPDCAPRTKEVFRGGIAKARNNLSEVWNEVVGQAGHAVLTFHGRPRAIMVPYIEPEAA